MKVAGERAEQYALGSASRRKGCYWSLVPGGDQDSGQRAIPLPSDKKNQRKFTSSAAGNRTEGIQLPHSQLGALRRFPQEMEVTWNSSPLRQWLSELGPVDPPPETVCPPPASPDRTQHVLPLGQVAPYLSRSSGSSRKVHVCPSARSSSSGPRLLPSCPLTAPPRLRGSGGTIGEARRLLLGARALSLRCAQGGSAAAAAFPSRQQRAPESWGACTTCGPPSNLG